VHKGLKTSSLHALHTHTAKFEYLLLTYFLTLFALDLSVFSIMQLGDQFATVEAAREAVKRYVLDNGESFKVDKSDKKRFLIKCKERRCKFSI
jgi:MuDR family transposase